MRVAAALRRHQQLLLPVFGVFVNEPVQEWMDNAQKVQQSKLAGSRMDADSAQQRSQGYARNKVMIARMKLQGYNSAVTMIKDMTDSGSSHTRSAYWKKIQELILGPRDSLRYVSGQGGGGGWGLCACISVVLLLQNCGNSTFMRSSCVQN